MLELVGKHTHTHAQIDGQVKNIMSQTTQRTDGRGTTAESLKSEYPLFRDVRIQRL